MNFLGLSPSVVSKVLHRNVNAAHSGVRRKISIYFADIRNFTGFIDSSQAQAEAYVQEHGLVGEEAERYIDRAAHDLLGTVNLYLSTIAEVVRGHNGTLDKYVGDAVMAFWGAPIPDERHAVSCVHAAMTAQSAVMLLNEHRAEENRRRQAAFKGQSARIQRLVPLPLLNVGSAINSGDAIVGFMGSAALMSNYTVFGAEVNIASRLEGVAGSGRIVISESTHTELRRFEPALADLCVALEPVCLRGISKPVRIYELPVLHPQGLHETLAPFVRPTTPVQPTAQ